jgi:N-acyl-D-amino-acid deacylase
MFDVLIKNGTVIDGTGEPMYRADIGINEEKISKIGQLQNEKGRVEIDADNLLVCPGFVDVNNHSDTYWQIFLNPDLESLVYQGITTILGGNCGSSLAPLVNERAIQSIQKWVNLGRISFSWIKLKEFLTFIENKELSVNFGTLVGYGTLRRSIAKDQSGDLDSKERKMMENLLVASMKEGSFGLSAGLVYVHTRLATFQELVDMAKVVKKYDGVFVLHLRNERDKLIDSIQEIINIAKESGTKIHISHLKVMEEKNWPLMKDALDILKRAQEEGMLITFDVYPYTSTGTVLHTLLPDWVTEGGKHMMIGRIKDPSIRPKIIVDMKKSGFDYSKIKITISPIIKSLAKRNISESAIDQGREVEDVLLDILTASEGHVIVSVEVLSDENIEKIIANPLSIISSNSAGYNLEHAKTGEFVHPRSFGTFPRVLYDYVSKRQIISWEEAIRKMTSFPAERFGISKRGKIKEKYFADIAIINKDEIQDFATTENPYQYSKGMKFVLVNGRVILDNGTYSGIRNGMVLKKN